MKLVFLLLFIITFCIATQTSTTEIQAIDFENWLKEYIGAWMNIILFIAFVIPAGVLVLGCTFTAFIITLVACLILCPITCVRIKKALNKDKQPQQTMIVIDPLQNVQPVPLQPQMNVMEMNEQHIVQIT